MKLWRAQGEEQLGCGFYVFSSAAREGSACMTATVSYVPTLGEIEAWAHELEALHARIALRFERRSPSLVIPVSVLWKSGESLSVYEPSLRA
jgi:hypothetical protein